MIKKLQIVLISFLLTACSSTVILPPLPDQTYLEPCQQLELLPDGAVLSVVATIVVGNYSNYKKCVIKNDDWIEWYKSQQKLYSSVTK